MHWIQNISIQRGYVKVRRGPCPQTELALGEGRCRVQQRPLAVGVHIVGKAQVSAGIGTASPELCEVTTTQNSKDPDGCQQTWEPFPLPLLQLEDTHSFLNILCLSIRWCHLIKEKREKPHRERKTAQIRSLTFKLINNYSNEAFLNKQKKVGGSNLGFSHHHQFPFLSLAAGIDVWKQGEMCYRKCRIIFSYTLESESGEWKSWLKAQHSENEDHGIWSHHFMGNRWRNSGNSIRLYFSWLQNHCRWWM